MKEILIYINTHLMMALINIFPNDWMVIIILMGSTGDLIFLMHTRISSIKIR